MKKTILTFIASLMVLTGVIAVPQAKTTAIADNKTEEVQSAKADSATVRQSETTNKKTNGDDNTKGTTKNSIKSDKTAILAILSIVALAVALLALAAAIFAYLKILRFIRALKELSVETAEYITKVELENLLTNHKAELGRLIKVYLQKIEESKAQVKPQPEPVAPIPTSEPARFISRVYYGVFQSNYNGVLSNKLTTLRESKSTVKIETRSETTARVSIVDNLSPTQFSSIEESLVDIVEGNPQQYDAIIQLEAGDMCLIDDVWTVTSKIKVKLL